MRALALAALALAVAACANPSPLEAPASRAAGSAADETGDAWRDIAARARPLDSGSELLDRALVERDPARRATALGAWMDAGGRIAAMPHVRPVDDNDRALQIGTLGLESLAADAGDHTVEAALYLAQRMRRDGDNMLSSMLAVAIVRKVAMVRPHAPPFAAKYAPADAEVVRAFDAEALWVARAAAWALTDDANRVAAATGATYKDLARLRDADPLVQWGWLASAPADRAGFQAALAAHAAAATAGDPARDLPAYAAKLFETVDAYQQWLTSGR